MEAIIFQWLDKLLRLDRLLELTEEDTDDYAPQWSEAVRGYSGWQIECAWYLT